MVNLTRSPLLEGCRIAITRPHRGTDPFAVGAESLGATVYTVPLIRIKPSPDLRRIQEGLLKDLATYHWIVFTSPNGVHAFFKAVPPAAIASQICAVGPGTAATLGQYGLKPDFLPPIAVGAAIPDSLDAFLQRNGISDGLHGVRILLPRSDQADPALTTNLRARGAVVEPVVTYLTAPDPTGPGQITDLINQEQVDIIFFASPSAVNSLQTQFEKTPPDPNARATIGVVSIGTVTARALLLGNHRLSFRPDWIRVCDEPTAESFAHTTQDLWKTMLGERMRRH